MRTHPPFARAAPRIAAPSRDARARRSGPAALRGLPARRATDAAHTRRAAALRGAGAAPAGAGRAGEPRRLTPRPAAPGPAPASPRRRPQARPGSAPRPAARGPLPAAGGLPRPRAPPGQGAGAPPPGVWERAPKLRPGSALCPAALGPSEARSQSAFPARSPVPAPDWGASERGGGDAAALSRGGQARRSAACGLGDPALPWAAVLCEGTFSATLPLLGALALRQPEQGRAPWRPGRASPPAPSCVPNAATASKHRSVRKVNSFLNCRRY